MFVASFYDFGIKFIFFRITQTLTDMNNKLRIITIVLLIFLSISAFFGGILFLIAPDGALLQISPKLLAGSIFKDYFYPGVILLVANGIIPVFIALTAIRKHKYYPVLCIAQGVILVIWITVEALIIKQIQFLQLIYNFMGIYFIVAGITLYDKLKNAHERETK